MDAVGEPRGANDGGKQISHYEVEKMDVATNQWLPVKSVKGLSLQVGNLVEGKQYQFLVRACNDAGDSADLETEEVITAKNPFDPPSKNFYAIGYLTLQNSRCESLE